MPKPLNRHGARFAERLIFQPVQAMAAAGLILAIISAFPSMAQAETPDAAWSLGSPPKLLMLADDQSVFEPPAPPREDEGINAGAVNYDLRVNYLSDYVYRGIDHNDVSGHRGVANLQVDTSFNFNLGKFPHPFVGLFTNVFNNDPISRFQEVRPYFGVETRIKPFVLDVGENSYIYPERENFNTSEVYAKLILDDAYLLKTDQPFLSPYILAAYDYDKNKGWYLEGGIKHDFIFEGTGLTLTFQADIAYISQIKTQFVFTNADHFGFQHYDVGMTASYSLNKLFNFSSRYGDWTVYGYLWYTDRLNNHIDADSLLWGGTGIGFKY